MVELSDHVVMLACFGSAPVARTLRDRVGRYGTILHVDDRRSIRKQLGARLLAWPTDAELQHAVDELLLPAPFDDADQRALDAMLDELAPPAMVGLVRHCTVLAHQRLSAIGLARALGVSQRTLSRMTYRAGWPPPSDLIVWGRVLRAIIMHWRGRDDAADVARLAGFRNAHALASALERCVGSGATLEDLAPQRVSGALRRVLSAGTGGDDGTSLAVDR
jgi:AraC-like DNA-binding protein